MACSMLSGDCGISDGLIGAADWSGEAFVVGLAGGVAARPNSEANGLDRRDAAVLAVDDPGRGRGGRGGFVGVDTLCGLGGRGSDGW